ncbi:MAG: hypothetical protein OXH68_12710 [Gammaproteobacteria bacterium]|nr:hypothetical protein [Gammaproteobacteria bacterium]
MAKWIGFFAIGCTIGVVTFLLVTRFPGAENPDAVAPASPTETAPIGQTAADGEETGTRTSTALADIWHGGSDFQRTAALYDTLLDADPAEVERLLQEAGWLRLQRERRSAKAIIYKRYAELDPVAAVARIVSRGTEEARFLGTVFAAWAQTDLDAAIEGADALQFPAKRQAGMAILSVSEDLGVARLREIARQFYAEHVLTSALDTSQAESDPEDAWLAAVAMASGAERTQTAWRALSVWIARSPEDALRAVGDFPEPRVRDTWRMNLVRMWAKADVHAAVDWARAQPSSRQRSELVAQAAEELAFVSPLEALQIAADLEPHRRRHISNKAFQAWGREDPPGALAALEDLAPEQSIGSIRRGLVAAWSGVDPEGAFGWAVSQPRSQDYEWLIETPLQILAQTSPHRAMALVDELDVDTRRNITGGILEVWSEADPQAAAAWIDAGSLFEPVAVNAVVVNYAMLDAEAAFDWVTTLPSDLQRSTIPDLMRTVVDDSVPIARRLLERIDDRTARRNAAGPLVARWVESDPESAVRWIADEEDSRTRSQLYSTAFQYWSRVDREGAIAAARDLPVSTRNDATMAMMRQAMFARDTEFLERLFGDLQGSRTRRDAAGWMVRYLQDVDPELADTYRELAR